jgi:hypothetical protein
MTTAILNDLQKVYQNRKGRMWFVPLRSCLRAVIEQPNDNITILSGILIALKNYLQYNRIYGRSCIDNKDGDGNAANTGTNVETMTTIIFERS